MSKNITIRDVPDEARDRLASRAARSGQSLQAYLRARLIELAERPDRGDLMRLVNERKQTRPVQLGADMILELRDLDRR
jgi:plasmid stability protein